MDDYDNNLDVAEKKLKPLLTDEFLSTLVEAAKTVGWGVDFTEIDQFIRELYEIVGKQPPAEIEPYEY